MVCLISQAGRQPVARSVGPTVAATTQSSVRPCGIRRYTGDPCQGVGLVFLGVGHGWVSLRRRSKSWTRLVWPWSWACWRWRKMTGWNSMSVEK